jgi:hypothetical protein
MFIMTATAIGSLMLGAGSEPPRVRADDVRLAALIEAGARRSSTLGSIVERLRSANVVVYVEFGRCDGHVVACLGFVTWATPFLYVRATVDPFEKPECTTVGLIAHELQHASELDRSAVRTRAQFETFFASHGRRGSAGYETDAAAAAGIRVEHECQSASHR